MEQIFDLILRNFQKQFQYIFLILVDIDENRPNKDQTYQAQDTRCDRKCQEWSLTYVGLSLQSIFIK